MRDDVGESCMPLSMPILELKSSKDFFVSRPNILFAGIHPLQSSHPNPTGLKRLEIR